MATGSLTRSRSNKILAGVCGGIANFTGWDAGVIRAITAVIALFTFGTVVLIYVLLWIVLPLEGESTTGLDTIVGAFSKKTPPPEDLR
ncbi:MAG: PspC domain-containing protein [Propionibacteriaceae bacterium]|jgi:phage shock protein C|nr:PspC domain-containing protein [Propionibacteriaceae bacterium]